MFALHKKCLINMSKHDVVPRAVSVQEDIAKLLRFESSALPAGQQTNLMEYATRMKAGTRNIYYLCAPNRHLAEHSPYYEAMKQKDMEVVYLLKSHIREHVSLFFVVFF